QLLPAEEIPAGRPDLKTRLAEPARNASRPALRLFGGDLLLLARQRRPAELRLRRRHARAKPSFIAISAPEIAPSSMSSLRSPRWRMRNSLPAICESPAPSARL